MESLREQERGELEREREEEDEKEEEVEKKKRGVAIDRFDTFSSLALFPTLKLPWMRPLRVAL